MFLLVKFALLMIAVKYTVKIVYQLIIFLLGLYRAKFECLLEGKIQYYPLLSISLCP